MIGWGFDSLHGNQTIEEGVKLSVVKKEATYLFKYDVLEEQVVAYVDGLTNTRFINDTSRNSLTDARSYVSSLNYKGSGATDFPTIEAELVEAETIQDNKYIKIVKLLYLLPDVNAYVIVDFIHTPEEKMSEWDINPEKRVFTNFNFLLKS